MYTLHKDEETKTELIVTYKEPIKTEDMLLSALMVEVRSYQDDERVYFLKGLGSKLTTKGEIDKRSSPCWTNLHYMKTNKFIVSRVLEAFEYKNFANEVRQSGLRMVREEIEERCPDLSGNQFEKVIEVFVEELESEADLYVNRP